MFCNWIWMGSQSPRIGAGSPDAWSSLPDMAWNSGGSCPIGFGGTPADDYGSWSCSALGSCGTLLTCWAGDLTADRMKWESLGVHPLSGGLGCR